MALKLPDSVIVDTDQPSLDFIPTADFEVVCKKGRVVLQTQLEGEYYSVGEIQDRFVQAVMIQGGVSIKIQKIEDGRIYRLKPIGIATAEVWQIT